MVKNVIFATLISCFPFTAAFVWHLATRPDSASDQAVTSDQLGQCPFGHRELKDVPITYGYVAWTPEMKRQTEELEVWLGGCALEPEKIKVVCANCWHAYDWCLSNWEKHTTNPGEFELPLSDVLTGFPTPTAKGLKKSIWFSQTIKDGKFYTEILHYWTDEDIEQTRTKLVQYLVEQNLKPEFSEKSDKGGRQLTFICRPPGRSIALNLFTSLDDNRTSVYLSIGVSAPAF